MFKKITIFALLLLCIIPFTASAVFKLPDTGQTKCYQDVDPYAEIPCAGTGQDGAYNINPMSYTDNGDGTVKDNNTGLTWQKQDDGNSYNWYQASGTYDVTNNPSSQNVCVPLNLGGHTDWRMPTWKELVSIVDYSVADPSIESAVFPNTQSSIFWSSTMFVEGPLAWLVSFGDGGTGNVSESNGYYVRCVRGGQSSQALVDNGNGTVTDNNIGLMWQQGEPGNMSWGDALSYCAGLSLIDYADWRLPNIRELESLVDDTRQLPAINTSFFPNTHASNYWSSTTDNGVPAVAWSVVFTSGSAGAIVKDNDGIYVRCVRGESGALGHFSVSAPASATAGTAFNFTVTALDQFNKIVSGYSGTVHFTGSDEVATLPANATLISGVGTFSATLKTTGTQTITATDAVTSAITGTSSSIYVSPAAATHFTVSAPATVRAGTAFNFTVTAMDSYNNTATGYSGMVHFTSSDAVATLPANATLTNGVGTFSATINSLGTQTIAATDTVTTWITGSSNVIYSQGVSINKGAPFAITTAVTLNLLYTGAVSMQFSTNGTTWTAWEKFKAVRSFTLPAGDGLKTVYVRFRDSTTTSSVYSATIILDTKKPVGTITINDGDYATNDPNVILSLSVADVNGVAQMQFSDNNKWTGVPWETFSPTSTYTIPAVAGVRTVYARFKDVAGNVSAVCSDTIVYNTSPLPPATMGAVTINGGAEFTTTTAAKLTITNPTHDPAFTQMCFSPNGTKWTAWETVKVLKSLTLPAGDGVKTVYVKFRDSGLNESGIYMNTIILDTKPPVGTISINGGAATTTNQLVTLSLSAADANGVTDMQFSTNNKWTGLGWVPFAPTESFDLGTSIPGKKSVYVRFKDAAGKISAAYSASIQLVAP